MPILGLMGIVLACSLGFAALSRPSAQGVHAAYTLTLTLLLFSIVAACYGHYRTFWVGFAVFGWGYAVLALAPGAWQQVMPYLGTTSLLRQLARSIEAAQSSPGFWSGVETDRFLRIGHVFAVILHGVAGGIVAVFLERRSKRVGSAIADRPRPGASAEDGPQ